MKDFAIWLEANGWVHWINTMYVQYDANKSSDEMMEGWESITDLMVQYLNSLKK